MILYLSGPMTGLPMNNYPLFRAAAAALRAEGHTVYDPSEWEEKYSPLGEFILNLAFRDYCDFITMRADAVVVLPGWQASPGASAEAALAKAVRKPVFTIESILPTATLEEIRLRVEAELAGAAEVGATA